MAKKNKKPAFDPNKPYEIVGQEKPAFDPNLPFSQAGQEEITSQEAEPGTPGQEIIEDVPKALKAFPFGAGDEIRGFLGALKEYDRDPEAASRKLNTDPDTLGALKSVYDKYQTTGENEKFWELYRKHRDPVRAEIKSARERSPWASIIAESAADAALTGGISMLPGSKMIQKGVTSPALMGGIMGLNESEAELTDEDPEISTLAKDIALGSVIGKTVQTAAELPLKLINRPNLIRTKFTGATPKQFEKVGNLGDPEKASRELEKTGLFKFGKRNDPNWKFSPRKMKFVKTNPPRQKTFDTRQRFKDMSPRDIMLERVDDMIKSGSDQVDNILLKSGGEGVYTYKDIMNETDLMEQLSKIVKDETIGMQDKKAIQQKAIEVSERFMKNTSDPMSLHDLNKFKRNVMDELQKSYDNPDISNIEIKLKKKIATKVKDFINNKAEQLLGSEGARVKQLNEIMHHAFTAKESLQKKVAQIKAGLGGNPRMTTAGGQMYLAERAGEFLAGGETGMLARASIGEKVERLTNFLQLNRKIPRTTNNILDYKNILYSKFAVNNPWFADIFKRNVLDQGAIEARTFIKNNARMIATIGDEMGIFEDSPYGDIDGIPSKEGAQKYRKDILNDDTMDNFSKAEKLHEFNSTGKLYKIKDSDNNNNNNELLNLLIKQQ